MYCVIRKCALVCVWRSVLSVQVIWLYNLTSLVDMTGGDCCYSHPASLMFYPVVNPSLAETRLGKLIQEVV